MKKIKLSTLALIAILLAYTIISFYKLGNIKNPITYTNLKNHQQLIYKIEQNKIPYRMMIYNANIESYIRIIYTDNLQEKKSYLYDIDIGMDGGNVFKWKEEYVNHHNNPYKQYLIIESYWDTTTIGEIQLQDQNGAPIKLTPMGDKEKSLIDEQNTVPKEYSYMNSTYFDEIYFARTAYEMLNGLPVYEYTHPPLGKLIMSIPIAFFGVTPLSYRLCGNIAGILMILIIYLIAKELFKRERYALFAAAIMALDGMHFVQTRIGTVDSFLVLFCLTSFLFFIKYLQQPIEEKIKKKMIPLLLSGIFWGMAISVKWTAAFWGLGMGIIYITKFIIDTIKTKKFDIKLILWSILSFIIIPMSIYIASYIPIMNNKNATVYYQEDNNSKGKTIYIHNIETFFQYQKAMYKYHSELTAEHPYSSPWYDWPTMKKPMWFYIGRFQDDSVGTIACMGNPAIWWIGIVTTAFTLIYTLIKRDKKGAILIAMIAATWLTYAKIGRIMYIYHYFITLPFVMLTIIFTISKLAKWKKQLDYIMPALTLIFLCNFIYFYPIYSGKPVNIDYIKKTEWQETWIYDGLPREE